MAAGSNCAPARVVNANELYQLNSPEFPRNEEVGQFGAEGDLKVTGVLSGTELIRPFIPAKDFELSKRFYEALGFEKVLDSEVAIFNAGSGGFILQNYFQEDWANNFMMQLMVDDLDAWWAHIESLDLTKDFGVPQPKPPALQAWGLRVAYVIDPSGVLWHISQRRKDAKQDQ